MTKQPMPNDAELFDKAADILERDGWGQDSLHLTNGSHCALGALEIAATDTYGQQKDHHWPRIYKRIAKAVGWDVPDWNDADERKPQEVIDVLREIAKEETKRADGN